MNAATSAFQNPEYLTRSVHHHLTPEVSRNASLVTARASSPQGSGIELTNLAKTASPSGLPTPSVSDTVHHPPKGAMLYQAAMYAIMFLEGWSDATAGPLLPTIQKHYNLNFTIVSMLFVSAASGFAIGAILNIPLTDKLGLGKIITYCCGIQIVAFSLIAPALPFPIMCVGYSLVGFTMALQNAQTNVFVSSLPGIGTSAMGLLHGFYGFGALSAPLVATQFAGRPRWSYFYLISLGMAVLNLASSLSVFKLRRLEELNPDRTPPSQSAPNVQENKFKQILRQKQVHLLAMFTMIYVGAEVTTGGWITTFLEEIRGGGPSSGYVSSGFFGGITVGRFVLWPLTDFMGKERAIYVYTVMAIGFELIVWLVPNLITNAIAVAIVGVVLGPLYPIVMNSAAEVLPKWILAGSIGLIASVGQMGSALFPFLTGLMATRYGVQIMQPIIIGLFGLMIALWLLVMYNSNRRRD